MPFRIGVPELIILMVVVMMVFGVGRLPQVSGTIGKALREFRSAVSGSAAETPSSDPKPEKPGDAT